MTETDTGYAPDRWEFDVEITRVFDDMLDRSVPQYQTMRDSVTRVASSFFRSNSPLVIDLGCSRGEALAGLADLPGTERGRFVGVEVSPPMAEAARRRFEGDARVEIMERDLRRGLPSFGMWDVALCVLTLMFVPVNYRQRLLSETRDELRPGGGIVLVEKVLGEGPRTDDVFNANYHGLKASSGYTPEEIERKRLSLEGVLVPLTATWNEVMLERAGFREVDCFWRWMNFAGWVAIK